jgi:sugar phosphate isomerase/epimerase
MSRLAAILYTVRDYVKTPAELAQSLKKIKAIGYDVIELAGQGPIDRNELKIMVDGEGLSICSTHSSLDRLRNDIDAVIEEHHLWGCEHIAIGGLPKEDHNAEGYKRFASEGSEIGRRLKEQGLTFSYHNHWMELETYDSKTGLDIMFEESDPEVFFFEIDTCWLQFAGGDPPAWIRKMKGRQHLVHFKDMILPSTDKNGTLEVGEGSLDFPSIIQACKETDVQWQIVEQDFCSGDPFDCIAKSYRNLKAMGVG